jgi:WD40 repeat protein
VRAGQPTATGGKIFYLDLDGHSIRTVRPDGSDIQNVISIQKRPNEVVENLVGDPSGTYLLFGLHVEGDQGARYFLVQNGRARPIKAFTRPPRWSPDGHRFVAEVVSSSTIHGPIYLYDAATGTGRLLPAQGVPDWFPDGKRLVYAADDIFTFDLATNTTKQLTHLPDQGDETWGVQEAHVLPDGKNILFYGGQRKNVGASGNGQQWWTIPVAGGTPVPFSDPGGNGILAFTVSAAGDAVAYAESAHASACLSQQQVTVTGAGSGKGSAMNAPLPRSLPQSETSSVFVQGLTWAPDGAHIAYALQPYRCPNAGVRPRTAAPAVYIWNVQLTDGAGAAQPRKLVGGSYPVWIR